MNKEKISITEFYNLIKTSSVDDNEDNYDDLDQMIKDIKMHASENGYAIFCADRPAEHRIGYYCANTGKTWSIKIKKIWECINNMEESKKDVLTRCFQTHEGKLNLVDVINKKIPIVVPTHSELNNIEGA